MAPKTQAHPATTGLPLSSAPCNRRAASVVMEWAGIAAIVVVVQALLLAGMMFGNNPILGFLLTAGASWGLAELLRASQLRVLQSGAGVAWLVGISGTYFFGISIALLPVDIDFRTLNPTQIPPLITISCAGSMIMAAGVHFWRFRTPVVLAAALFSVGAVAGAIASLVNPANKAPVAAAMHILIGLVAFGLAILADVTDVYRRTIRSRLAFWLFLVGASFVTHGMFQALQISGSPPLRIAIYAMQLGCVLALVALLFDRRWVMLYAMTGPALLGAQFTDGAIGSEIFVVGVFIALMGWWHPLRDRMLAALPAAMVTQLPRTRIQRTDADQSETRKRRAGSGVR